MIVFFFRSCSPWFYHEGVRNLDGILPWGPPFIQDLLLHGEGVQLLLLGCQMWQLITNLWNLREHTHHDGLVFWKDLKQISIWALTFVQQLLHLVDFTFKTLKYNCKKNWKDAISKRKLNHRNSMLTSIDWCRSLIVLLSSIIGPTEEEDDEFESWRVNLNRMKKPLEIII